MDPASPPGPAREEHKLGLNTAPDLLCMQPVAVFAFPSDCEVGTRESKSAHPPQVNSALACDIPPQPPCRISAAGHEILTSDARTLVPVGLGIPTISSRLAPGVF